MGGSGSGRIFFNKKLTVSDGLILNINNMGFTKDKMFLEAWKEDETIHSENGRLKWTRKFDGNTIASAGFSLSGQGEYIRVTLSYLVKGQAVNEPIDICSTVHNGSGLRFWFLCPLVTHKRICNRRASKLYLPNGAKYFGCRECYNLTYTSCQESHKLDGLHRLLAKQIGCSISDINGLLKRMGSK